MNDALDDWDKTTGKRFQNDEARKKARSLFVQGLAGEVLRERLQNKVDAGEQLNQRDRTLWAKLVAPAIRNTEEIMRFMAGAPTAVAIGAGQRFGELTQPKRELQDGQVVETAEGDTARKALAKSIIGAGVEYAIERRGGKLLNAGIGKVFRALPGGKALLGSISKMPVVGQAVDTFGKLARITGQQGLAGEVFEEGLQALADEGVGFAVRGAEKTTPISQRMAVAARTFAQPENMKDLVLGMLLTQAAQGGAAETMAWQRQATQGRNLDGILTAFGADGKTLRVMTPEDKQNAYAAIQQQLTPEKAQAVLQRMGGRAADAYNQIAEAKGFGFATTADPKERFIKKLEYVQDTAKRLAGDVPVVAYATEADLLAVYPEIALAKDYQANAICGTFYDGKTHVVLDKMHTPRDIVSTILHESGVHASLARMTPANKERILRGIGKNAMKQASEISQTLGVGDVPSAEEALALIGEQRVVKPSAYQRGVNALRNQIRAVYPSLKLNNSDLAVIVGDAQKAVRGEGGTFELMATVAPEAEQPTTTAPGVASETPVGETQTPLTPTNETQAIPPTAQVQELAPEPTPTVAQPTAANVVTPSALPAERVEQLPKNVQVPASIAQQAIIQEPVALNVVGQPAPISSAVSKRAQTSPVVPKVDTDVREREWPLSSKEEKMRNSLISKARSFGRKKQYALMNKSLARADALRSTAFTRSALDKVNRARIARGKKPIIGMTQLQRPPPDNVALKREFIAERGLTRDRVVAMSPAERTAMDDEFKAWWRERTDNPLSHLSPDQKVKEERAYKDTGIRFRKATREPQNTITAYKLFRVDERFPGKLFPLFVNATQPVDVGVWMDAESGPMKDGKVKSRLGGLAYRPGWHSGDLPLATHIGSNPDVKNKPTTRPANQVWTEVELPADRDWQAEANKRGTNAAGKLIPVKAQITDQIPVDGFYRYKTNSNMTGNWLISGAIKVNRVLSDEEVRAINGRVGTADLPRQQPFDFVKYGFDKTAREAGAQPQLRRDATPAEDYQRDLRDAGLADRYVQVPKGETKEVRKAQLLRNLLYADGLDREGRDGLVRKAEGELAQRKTEMALDAASGAFNTDRSVDSARMVAVMNATMLDAVKPDASVETMDLADEVNLKAQEKFTRLGRALAFLRDRFNTPEGRRAELARILMMPDDVAAEKLKIAKTEAERREIRRPIIAKARERLKDLRKVQVIDADGKRTPLDINAFTNDQLMNDALFKDAVSKILQQRASAGDKLYEFWQNSILSGPVTLFFVNPLGSAANIALELGPQRQAEILIGKALRSKDAPTTASTAAGFRYANEAMPDAWKNARITFTTEQSQLGEYANKWDTGNQAIGRKVFGLDLGFDVGKAVRSPRNWLSATDQGFRTWLMNFHVADLATRAFDNANKEVGTTPTEIERDAFIREAMKDDSEFYAQAQEIASRELFQTKPGLLGQMFLSARHSDNPIARTLSRYLLPFVTTPANVIKTGARKTPFGTIPLVWNFVRGKYKGTEAGKAEGVRLAAEQAVGWGVLMAVASLMEGDDDDPLKRPRITGTQQVSGRYRPGEREYEKRNEPPMSVRIGDNWFSYRRLEPVATILATIVDMLNAGKSAQAGDWSKAGQRIANSLVGMFSDRTYLKTVGDIIDAVRDNNPGSYMKIATGTAAGFVPNIAKTTMRGFDPVIHDIRNRSPKGTFEWLETSGKRLAQMALPSPVVIKQPIARYDVYGRPLTKAGGAAENILSPFTRQRADKMTKIDAMLKRYADKTGETNMLPAPPQVPEVKLFGKPEPVPLTDEEFAEYQRLAGQSAMKRLSAMTFRDYDNPTKYDVARVKKVFESTRKIARIQITNKVRQRIKRERGMAP